MSDEELERLARAATPGAWVPWCDHQPSLVWLCNDKDGVSIVTLGEDGFPDVRIADVDVMRTEEEAASWTIEPANKTQVTANVSYIAAANPATVLALLERLKKAEAQVTELVREGRKVSLNRDDAVDMLGRVRAERDELNRKLADLERKVLCPNFNHDWGPVSTDGDTVTQCRRCPATIHSVEFRPMQRP